jgi:hypothetical protein
MSTNPDDPNGQELAQDDLEVIDEASLAQVVGAGGSLARILNSIKKTPNLDLNASPSVALKPEPSTELPRDTKRVRSSLGNPLPFGVVVYSRMLW